MRWIKTTDQLPTKQDADDFGDVIIRTVANRLDVQNWQFVTRNSTHCVEWLSVHPEPLGLTRAQPSNDEIYEVLEFAQNKIGFLISEHNSGTPERWKWIERIRNVMSKIAQNVVTDGASQPAVPNIVSTMNLAVTMNPARQVAATPSAN